MFLSLLNDESILNDLTLSVIEELKSHCHENIIIFTSKTLSSYFIIYVVLRFGLMDTSLD